MISLLSLERMAKKAGVRRISRAALEELRDAVASYGSETAERAVKLSRHAGRKTVKAEDVRFLAGRAEK